MKAPRPSAVQMLWPWLALGACVAGFDAVGRSFYDGFHLDLGSLTFPTPIHGAFIANWFFWGGLASIFAAIGIARVGRLPGLADRVTAVAEIEDGRWLLALTLLGLGVPLAIRTLLLLGNPLSDDEGCYRFLSELLASGSLYATSPEDKLAFDHRFMVNDGRWYPQYFFGWPLLQAPGVWVGVAQYMNAFYAAATVPAVFLVARRLTSPGWAKVATLLFVTSPMLMTVSATEMSHTTCFMAIAWMTWCWLRVRDDDASPSLLASTGLAFFLCLAFWIRPTVAIGFGAPLIMHFVWCALRDRAWLRLAAFAVPSAIMAAVFLGVNAAQTGDPFKPAYVRELEYARENGLRYSVWVAHAEKVLAGTAGHINLRAPLGDSLALLGAALYRVSSACFGWPTSFLFVPFAALTTPTTLGARAARSNTPRNVLALSLLSHSLVHMLLLDPGFDSFAPPHWIELGWPILMLTVIGASALCERLDAMEERAGPRPTGAHVKALIAAMIVLSLLRYVPIRYRAIAEMVDHIRRPEVAAEEGGIENALVFTFQPWLPMRPGCDDGVPMHHVVQQPVNDPFLASSILWLNYTTSEANRRIAARFANRRAYVLLWSPDCTLAFVPMESLPEGLLPDAQVPFLQ